MVDQLLSRTSIRDLMCAEQEMDRFVGDLVVLTGGTAPTAARANHG
ncbi:MAG: hypothetical protein OXB91_02715 [Bryobacterales bacterium]|nr:hypothetical protein [Bryobacterales bacterium]